MAFINFLSRKLYFFFIFFFLVFLPADSFAMMSIEKEKELGRRLLEEIRSQVEFVDDQEIVQYVQSAGEKILKLIPDPLYKYRFFVIKDEGVNAFAIPGGYVFVHSGLLEVVDSDDEFICVLAHEIGHVEGRHIARRIERLKRLNIASVAAILAGVLLGKGKAGSAILATTSALNASIGLKYSREDEEEADRRAFQWLCKAGYNPMGLVTVLQKMQRMRWLGTDAIPSYLSTHPGTAERITYLEDLIKTSNCHVKSHRASRELRRVQVRISVFTKDPYLLIGRYKTALKDSPRDEYLQYGLCLAYLKAREFNNAINELNALIKGHPKRFEYKKDLGVAYYLKGDYGQAIYVLNNYLKLNSKDLTARLYLGKSFLAASRPKDALKSIKDVYYALDEDPRIAFDLGRCLAVLHQEGEAHYYFYQFYRWKGQLDAASYHKRMAIRLLPKDSQLLRKIGESRDESDENNNQDTISPSSSGGSGLGSSYKMVHSKEF